MIRPHWLQEAIDRGACSEAFAVEVQKEFDHIAIVVERILDEKAELRDERDAAVTRANLLAERAKLLHEECIDCGCTLEDPDVPPHCEDTCYPSDEQVWEWEGKVAQPKGGTSCSSD